MKAGPFGRLSTHPIKAHRARAELPGCRQELEILRLSRPSGTVPLGQGVWCSSLLSVRVILREAPRASAGFVTFRSSRQDGPTLSPHKDEGRYRGGGGRPRNHLGEKGALSLGATTERLPRPSSHFLEIGCLCGAHREYQGFLLFFFPLATYPLLGLLSKSEAPSFKNNSKRLEVTVNLQVCIQGGLSKL